MIGISFNLIIIRADKHSSEEYTLPTVNREDVHTMVFRHSISDVSTRTTGVDGEGFVGVRDARLGEWGDA